MNEPAAAPTSAPSPSEGAAPEPTAQTVPPQAREASTADAGEEAQSATGTEQALARDVADPALTGDERPSGSAPTSSSPAEDSTAAVEAAAEEDSLEDTETQPRSEVFLRERLGLDPSGWTLAPAVRLRGWAVTAVVTVVAAMTRLIGLGHPHSLMFDEIYYVKDAYALWHNGYESTWKDGADALFAKGDFSALTTEPSYVVHPQLGKWLIGLGMEIFGADSSFGWRFMPAVAGILTVALLARLTLRLTRSPALAGVAGLLLAIDGVGITESRIGLLDVFIGLFGLLTVYCLVRDREWFRSRLAAGLDGSLPGAWAPLPLLRPWLLAAGLSAGLTCSIKWSGAYLLAAVGILVVIWDLAALRRLEARHWQADGVLHRGGLDFLHLVPTAFVVYVVVGWGSWLTHAGAYKHGWAEQMRQAGTPVRSWLPDPLNDLLEYHLSMYQFHVSLDSTHPYMSKPIGWLVQWRPTSFYWRGTEEMAGAGCGSDQCVQAVTSIGNIPVWWCAVVALAFCLVVLAWRRRDWRVWAALIGYVGLYLPWFLYGDRTIFTFYTVAFVPFVVLVLTLALGVMTGWLKPVPGSRLARAEEDAMADGTIGPERPAPRGWLATQVGFGMRPTQRSLPEAWTGVPVWRTRTEGMWLVGAVVVAALVFAALWWPIWTGQTVSYSFWRMHMWLGSWI
ncbi:phospholipid carrier-dependent glycosyltransferase [Actinomyces faecalis]|uniref:dolichyl-phosphate-mannose--protein mannosyltransferase n=1 Tax=Actinomyces faecalis TaxID=2722820 RepID=UPI003CC81645